MTALAVLGDVLNVGQFLLMTLYNTTIGPCLQTRRAPASPTLSAQEGELDNLLSEPTGGWDDDSMSIAPRSIRYGKEGLLSTRLPSTRSSTTRTKRTDGHDQDARELGEVNVETVRGKKGWEPGISLEELDREEAELAKMDPVVPEVEFGEFAEVQPGTDEATARQP